MSIKSDNQGKYHLRYIPFVRKEKIRATIGFILLVLSSILAETIYGKGHLAVIIMIALVAWILAVFLTDKYVHKYPRRYFTYLVASHLKAAIVMAFFLWIMSYIVGQENAPSDVVWAGYGFFVFTDAFISIPRRRDSSVNQSSEGCPSLNTKDIDSDQYSDIPYTDTETPSIDTQFMIREIRSDLDKPLIEFIENELPDNLGGTRGVRIVDDVINTDDQDTPVTLLIGRIHINDVHRLNQYMLFCTERIHMGGYFVLRYIPFENVIKKAKDRYSGPLYWVIYLFHFIWFRAIPKIPWLDRLYFSPKFSWLDTIHLSLVKKRNRALSKAEVWGRLSYYGMEVVAESEGDSERYIIAQRKKLPLQNKLTSYYLIASLEKVGLNGKIMRTHKIRTMFPFSEFIQQRIFEDHGLASTGKFANDFRLTEYGRFLRKYWLDELPQIFDWLRGDIKLVGMRATSPHFLSLYPKELYDLYVQIKPGLIPPIFDESIKGFDQIVDVELTYLKSYWEQPIRTDVRYFFKTFTDIVFRGVRSK